MCKMYTWQKTKHIHKRQGFSWKIIPGRETQEAWRQDEMIGGKPPVVK
jgi:hypothetical protein